MASGWRKIKKNLKTKSSQYQVKNSIIEENCTQIFHIICNFDHNTILI